jgi:sulfur-carrier protein adenylyltransferase/sulfurtransferase
VAVHLAQAGVGRLTLMDEDVFDWRNVGRHVLDGSYVGLNKADALKEAIQKRFPDMQVDAVSATWEEHFNLNTPKDVFEKADLMVSLTGDPASNQHLDALAQEGLVPPVVFGWLEPFGVAAHAIFSLAQSGSLKDCTDQTGLLLEPVTDRDSHPNLPQEASCGAFYQPYSALSALHGVALVGELAIDALLDRQSTAIHRVWVGTASEFSQNKLSFVPKWHGLLNTLGFSRRFDIPIHPSNV